MASDSTSPSPTSGALDARWLQRGVMLLVLVGLLWRVYRYLLQFPIWGDEAMVALNIPGNTYLGLLGGLSRGQVAPLLWLWGELTVFRWLGPAEWAMRLPAFSAGCAALLLMIPLARKVLPPVGALLAVGLLAVSYFPVRHCCEIKPYAGDLLAAVALLLAAVAWLEKPEARWPLGILVLLTPLALLSSYPALLIAAAISVALLPTAWRRADRSGRALYVLFNVVLVSTFLVTYLIVGANQRGSENGGVDRMMHRFWAEGFPPQTPGAFLLWLVQAHTGLLLAYPLGGAPFGSVLTTGLCLLGATALWRSGRRQVTVLLALPFIFGVLAAALHRYPYGPHARLGQYLAPSIVLFAGAGLAWVIQTLARSERRQRVGVLSACGVLVLFALGGMARDWFQPAKTGLDQWHRQVVQEVLAQTAPHPVIILNDSRTMDASVQWLLTSRQVDRVHWMADLPPGAVPTSTAQVMVLASHVGAGGDRELDAQVWPGWQSTGRVDRVYQPQSPRELVEYLHLRTWQRLPEQP